jgi:cell division protein FtsB
MRKRYVLYAVMLCLAAILLVAWMSVGRNGLFDLFNMQAQKQESMITLNDLRAKNRLLASEIRRLREDPKYFESVARKELGLVRGNEIIYRVKEGETGTVTIPIQGK